MPGWGDLQSSLVNAADPVPARISAGRLGGGLGCFPRLRGSARTGINRTALERHGLISRLSVNRLHSRHCPFGRRIELWVMEQKGTPAQMAK